MFSPLHWALITPIVIYVVVLVAVFAFQRHLMYSPGRTVDLPADHGVPEMQVITLPTRNGLTIDCWYGSPLSNKPTIVLYHGNAGTLAERAFKARIFLDSGYGVLLAGYRGFGGNEGRPSEKGLYEDARAVLSYIDNNAANNSGVILYGESLGSGIAVQMAYENFNQINFMRRTPIVGLILEAPFTSMADAAAWHYPWLPARLLVWDRFDSIHKIKSIGVPLLIIHGHKDRTVPIEQGIALFNDAPEPKTAVWLPKAGHVDVYDFGADDHIVSWLKQRT